MAEDKDKLQKMINKVVDLMIQDEAIREQISEILKEVIGGGLVINKEKRHEVKDAYPTWSKSMEILDYKEITDLHTGISKMWEWAKTQPNRNRFMWDSYEIEEGIYDYWKNK